MVLKVSVFVVLFLSLKGGKINFMKKTSKKIILTLLLVTLLLVVGVTYAFFEEVINGEKTEVVTGQIYMDYKENSQISLKDMIPETKEEALKRTDENGVFNFTITGRNTSKYPIYYGISLVNGDVKEGKTLLKPEHIMIYLERDGEVLIDGIRYSNWDNQRIWVETINAGTKENIDYNYTLRMWIDTEIMVSDTNPNRDYTVDEWNNAYASLKVNVNGNLETMNMPLSIETSDTFVENNNAYFIAKISNFYDINDLGKTLDTTDNLKFQVTGTNSDMVFSYKDSEGNIVEETSETLNLEYLFNKNKTVEVQVFVKPKNDSNGVTDLTLKLSKDGVVLQDFHKRMNVYGNNFCLNNGLNKLYDCILASDSLTTDVETAKVNITNKGEVNLNDTAPTYTYVEEETIDVANVYSATGFKFYFGDSYEFNSVTGTFKLLNENGSMVITDILSNNYKNYYTCGYTGNSYTACGTIYRIKETSVDGTKYTISLGDKITYKITSSVRSEVGLYKMEDDYGDSYFYRGDVTNNNVYFGGYYWKIIRTNGDNSIRLIYNGNTPNATGISTAIDNTSYRYSVDMPETGGTYESRYADPTYVGYMYGNNFERKTSSETTYSGFSVLTEYYFADDFVFDEEKEIFRVKEKKLAPISKTFSEMNATDETTGKKLYELYPYTCAATTETGTCDVMLEVKSIVTEKQAKVIYHSYSSVDKDGTRTNEYSSNVKNKLESWYETNIVNKLDDGNTLITDYIVDGTFCNDRSMPTPPYNSGYLLHRHTYYGAYTRLVIASHKTATLKCSIDENGNTDKRDWFSSTVDKGNGLLEYPVGLITADEVALAGGKSRVKNENYYLRTKGYYWTMSPSSFMSTGATAFGIMVDSSGKLYPDVSVASRQSVRPVINIRSDVLIASGDGTIENPFTLKLS